MPVATCPCREELIDYAVGKLSEASSDALASHIEACPDCQAELAALPEPDDTLVARLRGPEASDPFLDEPECGRAVAQARAVVDCPDFCRAPGVPACGSQGGKMGLSPLTTLTTPPQPISPGNSASIN